MTMYKNISILFPHLFNKGEGFVEVDMDWIIQGILHWDGFVLDVRGTGVWLKSIYDILALYYSR